MLNVTCLPILRHDSPPLMGEWAGKPFAPPMVELVGDGRSACPDQVLFDQLLTTMAHPDKRVFGWQGWAVDVMTHRKRFDGGLVSWAADNVALVVPRQNGKGDVIEHRELLGALIFGEQNIMHSAHLLETAEAAWGRMLNRVEANPHLAKRLKKVDRSNGRKAIHFTNGSSIFYRSRSEKSSRGLQYELIVYDEAMYVTDEQIAALSPTQTAQAHSQSLFVFTGLFAESGFMHQARRTVIEGNGEGWAWLEWAIDDPEKTTDDAWVRAVNPSVTDGLIRFEKLAAQRSKMGRDKFAREHCNVHDFPVSAQSDINPERLAELTDPESTPGPSVVLGLHVARDLSRAWIVVASERTDGRIHVELAESKEGLAWVPAWLQYARDHHGITTPVYLSAAMAAGNLTTKLDELYIKWADIRGGAWFRACDVFMEAYLDATLVHLGQPELVNSLVGARLKDKGMGRMWDWANSLDELGPTVAATHAVYGVIHSAANAPGPVVFASSPTFTSTPIGGGFAW